MVGALQACFMAKRGFRVDVYEMRQDIRDMEVVRGRSINLALSTRGREALRRVGLEDIVISTGIPMYARMIHDLDGTRRPIPYGKADQFIMSVDRRHLNELLLTQAEKLPNVEMHFEHKIVACDFNAGRITFSKSDGSHVTAHADLVVGCDGAFSGVRQQMMKKTLFDYEQVFIPHGYMELCMEPAPGDKFAMEVNYLHIWARDEFMMIALPNQDKTYTCTLFMPFDIFKTLDTPEAVLAFFRDKFPDSLPLLGEKYVTETVSTSKALPLISVKCSPYHVKDRAVIMGDAAHAMVPFYGQGMNCGFEDCVVFDDILSKHNNDIAATLKEFTEVRSVDAKAMCDLAFYNYIEMRQSVNSRLFLLRKKLDNFLYWLFPNMWMPLYTSVSFSRTRYHQCIANKEWQDRLIRRALYMSVPAMAALGYCVATRTRLLDAPVSETIQQLVERLRPTWI
ncbi:kynurenine 3-monooxygenase-like isoform X2 [Mya arenaria]|uniref:kynurenine 3-monooxygenase-like isoform X2 n=1 Tax=Mya arenaria TaxID=6604 RepID=UPI0022E671DE|nr:kynurenine 3-monooxygenase-like isoform X2 [Mya arenaria]